MSSLAALKTPPTPTNTAPDTCNDRICEPDRSPAPLTYAKSTEPAANTIPPAPPHPATQRARQVQGRERRAGQGAGPVALREIDRAGRQHDPARPQLRRELRRHGHIRRRRRQRHRDALARPVDLATKRGRLVRGDV